MAVGLATRVGDTFFDVVQKAGVRLYALRGEKMARLLTPAGLADPYPIYDQLRAEGELLHSEKINLYLATSHALVSALARNPKLSADNRNAEGFSDLGEMADFAVQDHEMMLRLDDPNHARIRRLVGAAFSPRAVASWRPLVEKLSASLLDAVDPDGFDLITDYAVPLTVKVICELMGVPGDDWRSFRSWGEDMTATMGATQNRSSIRKARASGWELFEYFSALIARRRQDPGDDLLSVMIAAEEEGDRLSDRELIANAMLLLLAGFETTVNLVGNGTMALFQHPDQWELLRSEPSVATNAVEELLRYDSSVQFTSRIPTEDMELAGRTVPAGRQIALMLGCANRDPKVFADPARLDLQRENARNHLSFSSGTHHCLGANLARLEGEVAFLDLTSRFPGLKLAGRPRRRPTDLMRGYEVLPVKG